MDIEDPGAQFSQPERGAVNGSLHQEIEALIPRLRRYARALTRDVGAADELVQDCLGHALGKIHLWEEGTDLRAWLFTILHNRHVSLVRRAARERATIELQKCRPRPTRAPDQVTRLELRDLQRAFAKLPGGATVRQSSSLDWKGCDTTKPRRS